MSEMVRLTREELESYRSQGTRANSRYYCPIHGSDKQPSLKLNNETGHFKCYRCEAWGYLEEYRNEHLKNKSSSKPIITEPTKSFMISSPPPPTPKPELEEILRPLRDNLPGSYGEEYLKIRGIPLELAQYYRVGYASFGQWPHKKGDKPVRQWKWGRLVFPHENPMGDIVNLYGRAVGSNDKVPKPDRHDHLSGAKGVFNSFALLADTVYICEGVFDALSLIAAGYRMTCAIFGVDGLRWDWIKSKRVVFCLDQDEAGQKWKNFALEGTLRGKEIFWLSHEVYQGHKDLNELWVATGSINIGDFEGEKEIPLPEERWNVSLVDELFLRMTEHLAVIAPKGALQWMTTKEDLNSRYDQALDELDTARVSQNMRAFREALNQFKQVHLDVFAAFKKAHNIVDPEPEKEPELTEEQGRDIIADRKGWQVEQSGKVYSKKISHTGMIYIIKHDDEDLWTYTRAYWREGESKPSYETTKDGLTFKGALDHAENYLKFKKKRGTHGSNKNIASN